MHVNESDFIACVTLIITVIHLTEIKDHEKVEDVQCVIGHLTTCMNSPCDCDEIRLMTAPCSSSTIQILN